MRVIGASISSDPPNMLRTMIIGIMDMTMTTAAVTISTTIETAMGTRATRIMS